MRSLLIFTVLPSLVYGDLGFVNITAAGAIEAGVPEPVVLGAVKPALAAQVDAAAEVARLALITGGVGQMMEYAEADAQATAALKAPASATAAKYPMLAASIGIDIDPTTGEPAIDVLGVARSVTAARDSWNLAGAAIRKTRLSAKAAIASAATFAEAEAALSAVVWPSAA